MTVRGALERIRALRPHATDEEALLRHLSVLDARIACEISGLSHETPFDGAEVSEAPLLAPHPFDVVYEQYVCAMIDAACGEYERYASEMTAFNQSFADLAAFALRTRAPRRAKLCYFGGVRT